MAEADQLDTLLTLYRPNVGSGNFQPDVAARGGNQILARVIVALELDDEDGVRARFRELDLQAFARWRQAAIAADSERERAQ